MKLLKKFVDKRGELISFLKADELKNKKFGQIYFVTFNNVGTIRGNHYHERITEWFGIVHGQVIAYLLNLKNGKYSTYLLSASDKKYQRLVVPPLTVHTFYSLTEQAAMLNYSDKIWKKTDRFFYQLI